MRKILGMIIFCFLTSTAFAYNLGIVDMDLPESHGEPYIAYATDGRVYEISSDQSELIERAKLAISEHLEIYVQLSDSKNAQDILERRNEIVEISLLSMQTDQFRSDSKISLNKDLPFTASLDNTYITNFDSLSEAEQRFQSMRTDLRGKSQCYNRAHIWSWELNKKSYNDKKIQTGKIWLFFTKKYIKEYKYKWWFHIAPYVNINNKAYVMDRTYLETPSAEKVWTDEFIQSKKACTEVYKYSDYEKNQYAGHCFVIKSSLFYWQPWQVKNVETRNEERTDWVSSELKQAYRNGAGWFSRVP